MRKFFPFLLLLVVACKNDPKQKEQPENLSEEKMEFKQKNTTYYFIRHAEKELSDPAKKDPHLTEEGLERAAFWAKYFADKNIEEIYSTNYSRTIQTVIPLLDTLKLDLNIYNNSELYSQEFLRDTNGKTVLIVGHQLSLPTLMNKILGEEKYSKIPPEQYANLFRIDIAEDGSKTTSVEEIPINGNTTSQISLKE